MIQELSKQRAGFKVRIAPPDQMTVDSKLSIQIEDLLKERQKQQEELKSLSSYVHELQEKIIISKQVLGANLQKLTEQKDRQYSNAVKQIERVERQTLLRANLSIESQQKGKQEIAKLRLKVAERQRQNDRLRQLVEQRLQLYNQLKLRIN